MEEQIVSDIIEWDSVNWAKFLDFIDSANMDFQGKRILALGERNGGMSLFFALRGAEVLCSDLKGPTENARALHRKYGVDSHVHYAAVDAVHIPRDYDGQFDVVTFKSVFGGIGRHDSYDHQGQCVDSIYRVLRPKGCVVFAENMRATWWHMALRKAFRPTGGVLAFREPSRTLRYVLEVSPHSDEKSRIHRDVGENRMATSRHGENRYMAV